MEELGFSYFALRAFVYDVLFLKCLHFIISISEFKVRQIAVKDFIRDYRLYEKLDKSVGLSYKDVVDNTRKLLNR